MIPAERRGKPRWGHTAPVLLEAGERLFGRHGVEGVALRQIAAEAGSANSSAVHYHFGDVRGFVRAIFAHRLPALEAARREMLDADAAIGIDPGVGRMIDIMFRPFVAGEDGVGLASYAAFLCEIRKVRWFNEWVAMMASFPVTHGLSRNIMEQATALGVERAASRLEAVSMMVLGAIATGDASVHDGEYDDLIAMAEAAMLAGVARDRG